MNQRSNNALIGWFSQQKKTFRYDFTASIVVFLVAIPLCLGIALASEAPLFSGILSGIIGGVVVGLISNSQVSVSGPAAGMAAVVASAILGLGSFDVFLLALVFAGLLQIITGLLKAGFIADYIPTNVVQGLLCAIGLLLIIKQLPLAFTLDQESLSLKQHLIESTERLTLTPLQDMTYHLNSGAIFLTIISMGILIYFDKTKNTYLKNIPAPVLVVALGIILNELFIHTNSVLAQNSPQMVNIPNANGFASFIKEFNVPNWSAWTNPMVYVYGLVLAAVASLETLLNIKASERLDPQRRICNKDREMLAQGVGNTLSGLIGGIPLTSVIIRTSVNVHAGGKTKLSAIIHGLLLLISVISIPDLLNRIPLCSLAAILIYTGYKLTSPATYKKIYDQGSDRFIPFIITIISIIVFNLLAGILIGLAVSFFYILKTSAAARLDIIQENNPHGIINRLILPQQITFLNKASLAAELNAIPHNAKLIVDARNSEYIDKEILLYIEEFREEKAAKRNISMNMVGFKEEYNIHDHIDFIHVTTYEAQSAVTPSDVLRILQEGNARFLSDTRIHRSSHYEIKATAKAQHPIAVVLGCIDSRVPVETIFDVTLGDLFCIRIAGNVINDDIIGSMEFACGVAGAKLIVILGHTRCGAISAACDGFQKGNITGLLDKVKPALAAETETQADRNSQNTEFVNHITELNVAVSLASVYEKSDILSKLINDGQVGLVGSVYHVETGTVHFHDYSTMLQQLPIKTNAELVKQLKSLF